jgi:hypothetical protein
MTCSPNLNTLSGVHRQVPFSYWWDTEMVFFVEGRKFKRRQLVLDAANKDGGAHVDDSLAPDYKCLLEGEYFTLGVKPPSGTEAKYPTRFAHVAALRQIAHEVLNSPDLMRLVGRTISPGK